MTSRQISSRICTPKITNLLLLSCENQKCYRFLETRRLIILSVHFVLLLCFREIKLFVLILAISRLRKQV